MSLNHAYFRPLHTPVSAWERSAQGSGYARVSSKPLLPVGRAVESVLRDGETMPADLGGSASTQAIGDAIVSALERA